MFNEINVRFEGGGRGLTPLGGFSSFFLLVSLTISDGVIYLILYLISFHVLTVFKALTVFGCLACF